MKDSTEVVFVVHNTADTSVTTTVSIGGEEIRATVPCLEVELSTEDQFHGSFTLRYVGAQRIADARSKFQVGSRLGGSFEALASHD